MVVATDSTRTVRVMNTTETHVLFNLFDECTQYISIVSAWNEIGEGVQHTSQNKATLYKGMVIKQIRMYYTCMSIYIMHMVIS